MNNENQSDLDARLGRLTGVVGFDIETVPRVALEALPARERDKLTRRAKADVARDEGCDSDVEEEIQKQLALHPLLTRIVSIAFHAIESDRGLIVVAAPDAVLTAPSFAMSEPDALACFWRVAEVASELVGFNSRRFDVPVVSSRSALLGIRPSVDLVGRGRGDERRGARHIDALELLRARLTGDRPVSLELACFAFDISVKTGGHGSEVAALLAAARYEELASYNLEDACATVQLYQKLRSSEL